MARRRRKGLETPPLPASVVLGAGIAVALALALLGWIVTMLPTWALLLVAAAVLVGKGVIAVVMLFCALFER